MTCMMVSGWGTICHAGLGRDAFAKAFDSACAAGAGGTEASEPPPWPGERFLPNLDARELLERKGTVFMDRRSVLALAACGAAIRDSGLEVDDTNRDRIGVVLGTTWGSFKSMSDYTRDTLVEDRPYRVNAALFPNTVMNCATGQAGIWFGLRGVNATIAGTETAFLEVLRYAANAMRREHADVILAGAVEEYTPHTAWAGRLQRRSSPAEGVGTGEGAAFFVLESSAGDSRNARHRGVHILSVVTGYVPRHNGARDLDRALQDCIQRALRQAKVGPDEVTLVALDHAAGAEQDRRTTRNIAAVFGPRQIATVRVAPALGRCYAAQGAFQMAAVMAGFQRAANDESSVALVPSWSEDGSVGAAIVRG